ncbi:hypothetical protein FGG08_002654 [Glutinoglossum americanum]|uniref:BTB domain-containing protein n=1 Tax=Glutinoglossum americanum TaxID=1670608 RepID=A0A9P8L5D9_9PEZI|nr:hypothetical protein FGG08_002654 [Glutinoglossum americanum]
MATPGSTGSSNNTFLMPNSPLKGRRTSSGGYKPEISRTLGQRPACLVNASVTYCGNNQIYAFGGFDQYTDEVYNHVLKLDVNTLQWSLVDNYGDIPGVRMGHTATLYKGDKLLVYGGENEHRMFLSDVVIFDLKTAHWTQPAISGPVPKGRTRHASALYDDKLFIMGGISDHNAVLDDVCYLDLNTWTWSRSWKFIGRFDHSAWVWGGRMWVFGGLSEDMDRGGEIWWLDLKASPAFENPPVYGLSDRQGGGTRRGTGQRSGYSPAQRQPGGAYAANSGIIQQNLQPSLAPFSPPLAPGSISSLNFVSGPNLPSQASGSHFHVYTSGVLLDFITPASTISPSECCLSAFDLDTLRWRKLAEGSEIFNPGYRWHYCAMDEDGTKAWLLGCATDSAANGVGSNYEEYLSDVLPIDLNKFGILGNSLASESRTEFSRTSASERNTSTPPNGLGADLAGMFDKSPDQGSGADFVVTGEPYEQTIAEVEDDDVMSSASSMTTRNHSQPHWLSADATTSAHIHVHKLILQARWPHFGRLYAAQMAEFHTKKMHIPEPYNVVRAFLYYLYSDSIARHPEYCTDLSVVAGLLVMANVYDMPRLRMLCLNRLGREIDVEHAAVVWERAGVAGEDWLRRRAGEFCLTHWGRVVRTQGFRKLSRSSLMELCEEVDVEGRVVSGEELELVGGLGGGKFGVGGSGRDPAKATGVHVGNPSNEEMEEGDDEEGMEMN